MPLLADITSAQPSLQNRLVTLRAGSLIYGKALSSSFVCGNEKRLASSWKSLNLPRQLSLNGGFFEVRTRRVLIKAVATFETKNLVQEQHGGKGNNNSQLGIDSSAPTLLLESANKDSTELDEREKLRRMRISKANKGNTAWNKGRKHPPETIRRIKERTRIAMQDPKIRRKLANIGHAQSEDTKVKIGIGVRMGWQRRRDMLLLQEFCYFEWQNLIAEASRKGYGGQEELQWDSYRILSEQIQEEWSKSVEERKKSKPKGCRRAPKSPEQRRRIAASIAAKWADPEYRQRVCSGLSRHHATTPRVERKPRIKRICEQNPRKKVSDKQKTSGSESQSKTQPLKWKRHTTPQYKDPLADSKLEMIKKIRAQRAAAEARKNGAIERARLLIAEAQKAANALELAAETNSIARASLLEARKLIAEAIQSIESIETGQATTNEMNGGEPSDASMELASHVKEEWDKLMNHADDRNINGTQTLPSSYLGSSDYGKVSLQDIILNDDEEFVSTSTRGGHSLAPVNMEALIKKSGRNPTEQPSELEPNGKIIVEKNPSLNGIEILTMDEETPKSVAKTKKWVRGRLIEVSEEEEEDQNQSEEEYDSLSEEEYERLSEEGWNLEEEEEEEDDDDDDEEEDQSL